MRVGGVAKRLGLVVIGFAVVFALLEVVLRVRFRHGEIVTYVGEPVPDAASRWVDHPFFPFVGRSDAAYDIEVPVNGAEVVVHVQNNSYGFRSHEFPERKTPGDFFIVALGESTTWGAAAETNALTWPELLETRLRARYPTRNIRVFNLGTQNVTLPYSVVALSLFAPLTQPDLVITYHGYNDFGPATARGFRFDHSHFFRDLAIGLRFPGFQRSLPRRALSSYAIAYLSALADDAISANNLAYYVQRNITVAHLDDEGIKRVLMREWEHMRTIDAVARGYGGTALFSTFQFFDGEDRHHRLVNESLRTFFTANRLAYVDQEALIPDSDTSLQYDPCHFTRAGDERMAANFFAYVVEHHLLEN